MSNSNKKITYQSERIIEDEHGNQISKKQEKTVMLPREPDYVKVYLDNILYLKDLPKGMNTVLYALLKRIGYNNQLVLNAALKRQISEEIGLSVKSIDNSITKFVKGELLIRQDRGLYIANPHLFGRGEWRNISEIRMAVTFNSQGKTIMSQIEKVEPDISADRPVEHFESSDPQGGTSDSIPFDNPNQMSIEHFA